MDARLKSAISADIVQARNFAACLNGQIPTNVVPALQAVEMLCDRLASHSNYMKANATALGGPQECGRLIIDADNTLAALFSAQLNYYSNKIHPYIHDMKDHPKH